MGNTELRINGELVTDDEFRQELYQAAIEAMMRTAVARITSTLTPEELSQITVEPQPSTIDNIAFYTNGPHEIMNKIRDVSDKLGFARK